MTFAFILAVLGILAFMISGNPLPLTIIVIACQIAWNSFKNLKEKVEWLEEKLKDREGK